MKVQIIFPKDDTTDFLNDIVNEINKYGECVVHRLETSKDHDEIFGIIRDVDDSDLVLFLGHGTSNALSGAFTPSTQFGPLIKDLQLKLFQRKRVILLSCRSSEYLIKYGKECKLKSAIGFPNLITDWLDVEYPENPKEVEGISKTDVDYFRKAIIRIISKSLSDYLKSDLSFYGLHNRIKQRASVELSVLYKNSFNSKEIPLGRMIRSLRDEIFFLGD